MHGLRVSDVTRILSQIESGDPSTAEKLLPLVYDELRKLAAAKLAHEKPGQTLQATALVHEAYLRLMGNAGAKSFAHQRHFFAAAAEAMRRILVDQARRKLSVRHGGQWQRVGQLTELLGADSDAVWYSRAPNISNSSPTPAAVYYTGRTDRSKLHVCSKLGAVIQSLEIDVPSEPVHRALQVLLLPCMSCSG